MCLVPASYRPFLKVLGGNKKLEKLAEFFLCLSLLDYECLKFRPSELAASAVLLACCSLNWKSAWRSLVQVPLSSVIGYCVLANIVHAHACVWLRESALGLLGVLCPALLSSRSLFLVHELLHASPSPLKLRTQSLPARGTPCLVSTSLSIGPRSCTMLLLFALDFVRDRQSCSVLRKPTYQW